MLCNHRLQLTQIRQNICNCYWFINSNYKITKKNRTLQIFILENPSNETFDNQAFIAHLQHTQAEH